LAQPDFGFELGDPFGEHEVGVALLLALASQGLEREDDVAIHLGLPVEQRLQDCPHEAACCGQHAPGERRARLEDTGVDKRGASAEGLQIIDQRPRRGQRRQCVALPEGGVKTKHERCDILCLVKWKIAGFARF
jgi:hypothetical protein